MSEPKRYAILGVMVEPSYNAEEVTSEMIAVPNGAWVRHDDYARLQAEVERLTGNLKTEQNTGWDMVADNARLKAEVERLTAEVSYDKRVQLHIDKLATEFTQEQVERLTKAGDDMAKRTEFFQKRWDADELCQEVEAWNDAKEGKQS